MTEGELSPSAAAPAARADNTLHALLVEDNERDAALVLRALRQGGYSLDWERVETADTMRAALSRAQWEIVIADYSLPQFDALAALDLVRSTAPDLPFIIVSGNIGEDVAVNAMKAGAHDYIMKNNLARLVPAIERELREAKVRREHRRAEEAHREEAAISAALARVGRDLIASSYEPVLLERMCHLTTEILECDCSHTLLWDATEDAYVPIAGCGDTPEQWESLRLLKVPRAAIAEVIELLDRDGLVQHRVTGMQNHPVARTIL